MEIVFDPAKRAWTLRGEGRHVISMRKANEREKARFEATFAEAGSRQA
jgi:hypothetical protein